jgi:hypothetical protein
MAGRYPGFSCRTSRTEPARHSLQRPQEHGKRIIDLYVRSLGDDIDYSDDASMVLRCHDIAPDSLSPG